MRRIAALLSFSALLFFSPQLCRAQEFGRPQHAPSGGVQSSVISIAVPPISNAPFTATVTTVWVRTLDGGATITVQNRRTIARDTSGRVFQERRNLFPPGDPRSSLIARLEFADPRARAMYVCWPAAQECDIQRYFPQPALARAVPAGPIDNGNAFLVREGLGTDSIDGVTVVGTRETTTIQAGALGNDQAVQIVKEFWYSSQLGLNLIEKRQDPRYGKQTFTVSDINLGEPASRLFELPAGFRIVDKRGSQSSAPGSN
jgi:hypothetical protein